jgi:hypothetical protein
MKNKSFRLLTVVVLILMLAAPMSAQADRGQGLTPVKEDITRVEKVPDSPTTDPDLYIILLEGASLSSYTGGIPGLDATNPAARGETKLDAHSPASVAYLDYLANQHAQLTATMEQALGRSIDVLYRYDAVLNGLAVRLSAQEAKVVARLPGVRQVERDFMRQLDTDVGPAWVGAQGIWDGSATGQMSMGEGLIIGMIDTGINGDHPSFADVGGDGYDHTNPLGAGNYLGWCDAGTYTCNDKLIGVYDMTTANDPEDSNGHGSHTASTVAGNVLNNVVVDFPTIEITRSISGVAPHANIIAYRACLPSGCPNSATNAAINQAVTDGVDAINYSIGGGASNPWTDSNSLAYLDAREAGVFVATSAGNNGPGAGTVGSPANSPWLLSVGNATHNRTFINSISFTGGPTALGPFDGTSVTSGYGPEAIVHAGDYGDALCGTPFAPGTWTGEIVVCDRGTYALVDKVANAANGGAGAVVIANAAANGLGTYAIPHELPSIHLNYADSQALRTWLDSGSGHMATLTDAVVAVDDAYGDRMSVSSSRGPNSPVPDVIKPDVIAPGSDILAAYKTPEEYNMISGTSMASPHAAGASLLLRSLYPNWTPAMIQSALVSTAIDDVALKEDWLTAADPFDMGGGRVYASNAAQAGFVLDETIANYQAANPALGGDPSTLNLATLAQDACPGTCTWTRVLSSTQDTTVSWTATVAAPVGMNLTVEPAAFDLAAYATQMITVTADVGGLPIGDWVFGRVTLTPSTMSVAEAHLPVAVVPEAGPPIISLDPGSFDTAQRVDTVKTHPLMVGNTGGSPLEWQIFEDATGPGSIPALANWSDNFDSYATDLSLHGVGGWKGWSNAAAATAYTRDTQASSAPNSVEIVGASDLVHEYSGYTGGIWKYRAWQYIPTDFTGESYFILLNQYDDAGATNNWSTQVNFNGDLDLVVSEGESTDTLPMIRGQWVEIRVEINLVDDIQKFFYGGNLLYQVTWTNGVSGGGILNIAAVDLFANTGSEVYYDDMSLVVGGWSDNFDSYPTDTQLQGVGGWKGWANDPAAAGWTRDTYARSAPNALEIVNFTDAVHEYSDYTSGIWNYTAWQYIPTGSTGESYFILLNQYDDAGAPLNWSTQVNFNSTLDLVVAEGEAAGATLPLVRDQWMEIRVEINLVDDVQKFFYGGNLLYESTWTDGVSGGGILNIAAVDLWGNGASAVYYDDMSLTEALAAICDLPSEIPWVSVAPASGTTLSGEASTVDVSFDTSGLIVGDTYNGTLCVTSNDPVTPLVILPLTLTVVLQDVTLSPASQTLAGAPGEIITHTYTLTNTGLASDSFTLSVAGNSWPTSVISMTGELGPGEATTVNVVVTIPTAPAVQQVPIGSDTFTLTAISIAEPSVMAQAEGTTVAEATPAVDLGGDQAGSDIAGVQVTYVFSVTNMGNYTDTFSLTLTGWVWPSTLSMMTTEALAPDASQTVTLTVDIPLEVTAGDTDTVTLTAISMLDPGVSDSALATTVAEATSAVDLGNDQTGSGAAGGQVTYVFTVTNMGIFTDTFSLTLTGWVWPSTLSMTTTNALAPGASQTVTLTVGIPLTATAGVTDTVTLTAISMLDPGVSDSAIATTLAEATPVESWHIYLPIISRQE